MNTSLKHTSISQDSNIEMLYVEKNLEIGYNQINGYLHCNWVGFQSKEVIMRSGEKILECLILKQVSKVLNDNTQVSGPWHDAAEWTATNWFPRMEKAGLRYFAWIFSPNIFAELSAKKAMPASGVVKSFAGIQTAKDWLKKMP